MHLPTTQKRRTCMTHIQPGCALIGWRDAAVGRSLFLSHQQLNNLQFYVTWWGILRSSVAVRSSQSPPPVLLRMGISRRIWKRKKQSFTLTCWIYAEERPNLLIKAKPRSTRQIICGWRVCALVLAYFSADIESFLEKLPERHCLHKHCTSTQSTGRNIPETTSANCCTNAWNEATVWHKYVLLTVVLSTGTCLYILIGSGSGVFLALNETEVVPSWYC